MAVFASLTYLYKSGVRNMSSNQITSMTGDRKTGFGTPHVTGAIGAVIGAVANYAEGHSVTSCVIGGVVGVAASYAMAEAISSPYEQSTAMKITSGLSSALFGIGISSIATGLSSSIEKLTARPETQE